MPHAYGTPTTAAATSFELLAPGREALAAAEQAEATIEDAILGALSDEERATLHELLTRALRSIEPADGEADCAAEPYSATIASIST